MNRLPMSPEYEEYFKSLVDGLNELYEVARRAKQKGLDPSLEPEPQITHDIAERVEKLIGPPGIGSWRFRSPGRSWRGDSGS